MESGQEVSIVGLGYVGLPLLALAARSGWSVIGIDSDQRIIDELRQGISHIEDVEGEHILSLQTQGKVKFASSVESVSDSDVVVFCLPTPLRGKQPDLTLLLEAVESYSPNFKDEVLIISESSSYPGTLREKIMPICEKFKGEKVFHYGHSPERVDPGNKLWNNFNTPRIISGIDRTSLEKIRNFYGSFCRELVEVDSPEIAEAAKMFENSFRQVNIALVNEFARYCHQVGISGRAVLDAAATKPFGFMKFNYGAGVGGHCIPVDPYYLLEHARGNGRDLELIDVSNRINSQQPQYVFERITELLGDNLELKRIVIVGLSYKSNTSDIRESPSLALIEIMSNTKCEIFWFDPLFKKSLAIPEMVEGEEYDLAVVITIHNGLDYSEILGRAKQILDCTNSLEISEKVIQL